MATSGRRWLLTYDSTDNKYIDKALQVVGQYGAISKQAIMKKEDSSIIAEFPSAIMLPPTLFSTELTPTMRVIVNDVEWATLLAYREPVPDNVPTPLPSTLREECSSAIEGYKRRIEALDKILNAKRDDGEIDCLLSSILTPAQVEHDECERRIADIEQLLAVLHTKQD